MHIGGEKRIVTGEGRAPDLPYLRERGECIGRLDSALLKVSFVPLWMHAEFLRDVVTSLMSINDVSYGRV